VEVEIGVTTIVRNLDSDADRGLRSPNLEVRHNRSIISSIETDVAGCLAIG